MKNLQFQFKYLILAFALTTTMYAQDVLGSKYYFFSGVKVFKMEQRNDTLYQFKCITNFECSETAISHFKILKTKQQGNRFLLQVEVLDSLKMAINPIPDDRFKLIGIEKISDNSIRFINEAKSFTKDSISKIAFEVNYLDNKFGYTYYKENYLKSFKTDYVITEELASEIMGSFKNYSEIIKLYNATETGDMYGIGLGAELLAHEMIRRNLSPINAKQKISKVLKK